MKTTKHHKFTMLACTVLLIPWIPAAFAQESSTASRSFLQEAAPEPPKTTAERLKELQKRHEQTFSELSTTLNRLPTEPGLLGTKELFSLIDQSDREIKKIRSACVSVMSTLRSEMKTIQGSSSFTAEQKQELAESAEALANDCSELTDKLDIAVNRLSAAYTILPRWNKIHKAYRNLQGNEKAAEQVRGQVEDYLKSFTPEAEETVAEEKQDEGAFEQSGE